MRLWKVGTIGGRVGLEQSAFDLLDSEDSTSGGGGARPDIRQFQLVPRKVVKQSRTQSKRL